MVRDSVPIARPIKDYLKPNFVRTMASPSNFRLGKEIASSGKVDIVESGDAFLSARVMPEGGETRKVELRSTAQGLTLKCTCSKKEVFCKHCVAVALVAGKRTKPG